MFITEANISMSADYRFASRQTATQSLEVWVGDPSPGPASNPVDRLTLSDAGKDKAHASALQSDEITDVDEAPRLSPKLELIKLIIEAFTGRKIRVLDAEDLAEGDSTGAIEAPPPPEQDAQGSPSAGQQGWGLVYTEHQTYQERQELSFAAEGVIRTKDGQEIAFSLELSATREFAAESSLSIRAGDAKKVDPLVINFNGLASELTSATFAFDLDVDGQDDNIHFVKPGSGFLALDANGDGKVNDGGELFGPGTGNGLAELAAHDVDGNRWIDEGDPIYERLSVWSKDGDGHDTLASLKGTGVGAIYLDHVNSRFDLKGRDNALVGQANRFGIYVSESGRVGSLQQIDLVV